MALKCPRCRSKSVRHDRSLGGRAVCSVCGTPMVEPKPSAWRHRTHALGAQGQWLQSKSIRNLIAWLLPISLVGSYVYLMANPRAVSHWIAPYSPASKNDWWIKTPADVELLIGEAQKGDGEDVEQSVHATTRELIFLLKDKGVRLLVSERVTEHAAGVWDPNRAEIRILPSTVALGSHALEEVIAHESAHVAQSCRAGGLGEGSEPMGIKVDAAEVFLQQLRSPLYEGPAPEKAIELEAFSVGANPPWAIKLLDYFCKS